MEGHDFDTCPQFSRLISEMNKKLSSRGVSKSTQNDYDQAVRALSSAHQDWLHQQIFYHEIGEVLVDLQVRGREKALTHDEEQFKDILTKALAFAELEDYLDFSTNPSSKSTLLNVGPEDVHNHNTVKHHLPMIRQILVPMVEEKLNKKCLELYSYHSPGNGDGALSSSLILAKAHALPGVIEEMKRKVKTEEEELKKCRQQRDKVFRAFYLELLESLSMMESIVRDLKLSQQAKLDKVVVDWLEARAISFLLKIKRFQLQVLCETYSPETVKALKTIGRHLDSATKQTESELALTTHSLQFFHSLGSEFSKLVEEFTQISSEIGNKKWGLEHIMESKRGKPSSASVNSGDVTYRSDQSSGSSMDTYREATPRKK